MAEALMFVVDTNVLIYHADGDAHARAFFRQAIVSNVPIFLPTIVALEFLGYSKLTSADRRFFSQLLHTLEPVPLSLELATDAAEIRRRVGLKLADAVIAATALATNSTLVTRNVRDFKKVPKLTIHTV